jgi:hypothetical protein
MSSVRRADGNAQERTNGDHVAGVAMEVMGLRKQTQIRCEYAQTHPSATQRTPKEN